MVSYFSCNASNFCLTFVLVMAAHPRSKYSQYLPLQKLENLHHYGWDQGFRWVPCLAVTKAKTGSRTKWPKDSSTLLLTPSVAEDSGPAAGTTTKTIQVEVHQQHDKFECECELWRAALVCLRSRRPPAAHECMCMPGIAAACHVNVGNSGGIPVLALASR